MTKIAQIQEAVCAWARQRNHVNRCWLFGSVAKGTDHAASDVDIAIELDDSTRPRTESKEVFWICESTPIFDSIREETGLDIRISQFDPEANPIAFNAVLEHGILLYLKPDRAGDLHN